MKIELKEITIKTLTNGFAEHRMSQHPTMAQPQRCPKLGNSGCSEQAQVLRRLDLHTSTHL